MTKTQNSLLNTPLRSPVTFLGAPRNPVPEQEIPPLPTPRVSLASQRLGMKTTPLGRSPLLALPAQPREKQPLQRVDLQKQSVGLQTLSLATMELSATPMPTQKLKPMKPSSPRVSRETTAKSKQSINDRTQAPAAQGMSVAYLEYHSRTIGKHSRSQLFRMHLLHICSLQALLCRSFLSVAFRFWGSTSNSIRSRLCSILLRAANRV